jgi:hypothetical protein
MGATDFAFILNIPTLEEWGKFMDGYRGSPAAALDKEWDELAACPDSAMFLSVKVE